MPRRFGNHECQQSDARFDLGTQPTPTALEHTVGSYEQEWRLLGYC